MLSPAVGDTTCSTSLQTKKQRPKGCFILGGYRSLLKFEHAVASAVYSISRVLAGSIEFSVHFGSQVVYPALRRWDLCQGQLHPVRRKPLCDQFIRHGCRCSAQELVAEDVEQLVQPCRRGCLFAWNNTVFANAMATFSQCDWTFCLVR